MKSILRTLIWYQLELSILIIKTNEVIKDFLHMYINSLISFGCQGNSKIKHSLFELIFENTLDLDASDPNEHFGTHEKSLGGARLIPLAPGRQRYGDEIQETAGL